MFNLNYFFNNKLLFNIPMLFVICFFLGACGSKSSGNFTVGQKVAKTAHSQIGKDYVFGGASPQKGFDCSGLIWWAYKEHGITVPRVTKDQATTGKKISSSNAKPGDIVVFKPSHSSSALHTGLYLGANKFIHSPRTGAEIRIESINNSYWKPKLKSVRRVIN